MYIVVVDVSIARPLSDFPDSAVQGQSHANAFFKGDQLGFKYLDANIVFKSFSESLSLLTFTYLRGCQHYVSEIG